MRDTQIINIIIIIFFNGIQQQQETRRKMKRQSMFCYSKVFIISWCKTFREESKEKEMTWQEMLEYTHNAAAAVARREWFKWCRKCTQMEITSVTSNFVVVYLHGLDDKIIVFLFSFTCKLCFAVADCALFREKYSRLKRAQITRDATKQRVHYHKVIKKIPIIFNEREKRKRKNSLW